MTSTYLHKTGLRAAIRCVAASILAAHAAFAFAGGSSTDPATLAASASADHTDRIVVRYKDGSRRALGAIADTGSMVRAASARQGFSAQHLRNTGLGAQVWKMDRHMTIAQARALAKTIAADPDVEYAEPDHMAQIAMTPNDPSYGSQWHYFDPVGGINLPTAWDRATGAGVVVAVIDTGYRPHADLASNIVAGYDFIANTTSGNDGSGRDSDATDTGDYRLSGECGLAARNSTWHGTHVAGTIAAVTNNGVGVSGVAFNAKVQPVRVLGKCDGYMSDIADGILWAAGSPVAGVPTNTTPAKVLNLSLGGPGTCAATYANAIATARSLGSLVVIAAGNSAQDAANTQPGNCPGVLAVAATDTSGGRASFSNFGASVGIAAPGVSVLSTLNSGATTPGVDSYAYYQGTSMATPHVAGVAALMASVYPSVTPDQLTSMLKSTARAFPVTCTGCGSGIVNARAAVDAAIAAASAPTSVAISPSSISKTRTGTGIISTTATATVTNGTPPYAYSWTSLNGEVSLTNATTATVSLSAYLEVCGNMSYARVTDQLTVRVTDATGHVFQSTAPVTLTAYATNPKQICR
jgi:serine protease